ncbi:FMN-dependent alpha-hydroxy acid dehydrogenase [Aspergillus brunneoviolaceus CBS 621.78]|uniref:Uncharacterized protein n=1 Tax=Aspergillus brunneoviolaceus CBS 621.78 TaxID=1450534 RepID=A0ACD1GQH6_9EURO|nr:hypothetical protein BO95DRAFT_402320 [Aspergillus brunneoviolaceus CBS 621.78]RAH51378.1 hypothetical protein BO95DRAFT_402320 [Aspergillus brunneoviolaceus CBS 621.78]
MTFLTREEIERHSSRQSCWVAIHGSVYDVTDFIDEHPGGPQVILRCAGKDATADFDSVHDKSLLTEALEPSCLKGTIQPGTLSAPSPSSPPPSSPSPPSPLPKIVATKTTAPAPPLSTLINLHDFEKVAHQHLSPHAWAYYASGADDEHSKHANAKAYRKVSLRPRILRSIRAGVDTRTTILGQKVSLPVYMSPTGIAKLAHPDAECALAAAAGHEGLAQVLANGASMPIERVRAARTNPQHQPLFAQLYVNKDRRKSVETVRRAVEAGACGVWVTVDSPVVGKREMDERLNLEVQARDSSARGQGVAKTMASSISPFIDWEILTWLRNLTDLPIVIKGIQCVEDAVLAYQRGVQGIVLSNHGGRSQDTITNDKLEVSAQPPLVTLLEIRRHAPYLIGSRMQIFVDGGIRRGTDVLKALALGASAVGLGRPFLYGLAAGYGEEGVRRVIAILRQEIEANMVFLGVTKLAELGPHLLNATRLERDVVGEVKL